ncbi:hypothetical protein KP509_29G036400 [Ceratopteris richardii]|nr:hypothetical protein KP509_29G036400 [Ceratopteris richardii]
MDRVVDFQFGMGEGAFHIILELYSQGNLLLTDSCYNVLTLLRTHRDEEKGLTMMARHQYPVDSCRPWKKTSLEKLESLVSGVNNHDKVSSEELNTHLQSAAEIETIQQVTVKGRKSGKKAELASEKDKYGLKNIISEGLGYGPTLSEHLVLGAGLPKNLKVFSKNDKGELISTVEKPMLEKLHLAIVQFEDWLESIIFGSQVPEGFILLQRRKGGEELTSEEHQLKLYEDFSPLRLNQTSNGEYLNFTTFDAAMDEFFSKVEGQKAEQLRKAQEDSALQKLSKIRKDQESRVEVLKLEVDHSVTLAELIEYNLDDVDSAILAVRSALATGMNWSDLNRMIKEERKAGNPVASIIHSLQLEKNQLTLLLCNNLDDMDEEERTKPATKVEVDLSLSAHANARQWFDLKKKQLAKQKKTVAAHEKAFKAAERKTQQQLAQEKVVAAISHIRKVHWFEKFNWFISSENYLVISGRDAQQNELLVKRYMKKGDLYVHADLHGASSTIIKNPSPNDTVPPLTLNQAGCFTVCHSQAWDSKIVTSAWWVYAHQVSKTAPTGEYLTVGSFMIRGKKNFLPPHPLVMGFGVLFRLDESCVAAHLNDRKVYQEEEEEVSHGKNSTLEDLPEESDGSVEDPSERQVTLLDEPAAHNTEYEDVHMSEVIKPVVDTRVSLNNVDFDELMDKALELSACLDISKGSEKYGLNVYTSNEPESNNAFKDEKTESIVDRGASRQRPYMSKAERRRAKKGILDTPDTVTGTAGEKVCSKESPASDDIVCDNENTMEPRDYPTSEKVVRGRKGKLKKIKEKYAEQDDEEREIRMGLLMSSGKQTLKENSKKAQKTIETKSESMAERMKICYKCKKSGHVARECTLSAPSMGLPEAPQHQDLAFDGDSNNESIDAEGMLVLADDEKEKLSELDLLTAKPYPDDVLLYAIPVCGPYNALQGYKYRVKLTPGNAKRGKAAKTAMNVFLHIPDATQREKELMKAMNDPELVAAIIGNTKITAPGLTQLKHRQKKGKKTAGEE